MYANVESALRHNLLLYTHRYEWKLLNVSETDWKWGHSAPAPPRCDEIPLNVMMSRVCSPPGCIFVKEEKEKGLSTWSAPPVIGPTSALGRGQVKQCVPYLKNKAFIGLSAHYHKKTIANSDFMCPLKKCLNSPVYKNTTSVSVA